MQSITTGAERKFLTAQRLQIEGTVLDDILDGYHRAGHHAGGTRHMRVQLVADLQCRMMLASTLFLRCDEPPSAVCSMRQDREPDDISIDAGCFGTPDQSVYYSNEQTRSRSHQAEGRQLSISKRKRAHLHMDRRDWHSRSKAGCKGGIAGCGCRHSRVKTGVARSLVQNVVASHRQHLKS
jgi:hypothetical protein